MSDIEIARLTDARRELADKAAAIGKENLVLREANAAITQQFDAKNATIAALHQQLTSSQNELAVLKRSRLLRLGRKIRQMFGRPTWN